MGFGNILMLLLFGEIRIGGVDGLGRIVIFSVIWLLLLLFFFIIVKVYMLGFVLVVWIFKEELLLGDIIFGLKKVLVLGGKFFVKSEMVLLKLLFILIL